MGENLTPSDQTAPTGSFSMEAEPMPAEAQERHVDSELYDKFTAAREYTPATESEEAKPFGVLKLVETNAAERKEQKAKFLAGEIRNPDLHYPNVDEAKLAEVEDRLLALKSELANEPDEDVRNVYRWRINETIAQVRMIKQTAVVNKYVGRDDLNEEEQAELSRAMHRFARYAEFVYGKPSPQITQYAVETYRSLGQYYQNSDHPRIRTMALNLLGQLDDFGYDPSGVERINEGTFNRIVDHTQDVQGELIDIEPFSGRIRGEQLKAYFDRGLSTLGLDELGWRVRNDDGGKLVFTVASAEKTEYIPPKFALSLKRIRELLVHETGTHAVNYEAGLNSRLRILALGLDRSERGDEGQATVREQSVNPYREFSYIGQDRILAVALAQGLDGKPRDFRDTYSVVENMLTLQELAKGKAFDKAVVEGKKQAWLRTMRVFRGTNFATPGVCYPKDIAYAEGNIGTWYILQDKPEMIQLMLRGTFDMANPRHLAIVMRFVDLTQDLPKEN